MFTMLLTLFVALMLLLFGEYLHRKNVIKDEVSRKFVHIVFGVFVATWPYYLDKTSMILLAIMLVVGVLVSYYLRIFTAIHSTKNRFIGEILYALGILCAAYISTEAWVFTTSVLCMALADGMAAVVGTRMRARTKKLYRRKTLAGTVAFLLFAYVSLGIGFLAGGAEVMGEYVFVAFVWLPAFLTMCELVAPWGTDNVVVPVVVASTLNALIVVAS